MKRLREEFVAQCVDVDPITIHFVDECATHDSMVPLYGRAPSGKRACGTKPRSKGNHLTVVGSLSLRDGLSAQPWPGSMKGADFASWVETCLVPKLRRGDTVVLDNGSIHKSAEVIELVESVGARVLFLAPYSPDLNPIEEAWSKFKNLLRRARAAAVDALCEAIFAAARQVTQDDTRRYVRHAGYLAST